MSNVRYVGPKGAAAMLGVNPQRIYDWVREDRIKVLRIGKRLFFDTDDLERPATKRLVRKIMEVGKLPNVKLAGKLFRPSRGARNRHTCGREEYERRYTEQQGKCAICGEAPGVLHVDHDHATRLTRGLLCQSCNHGLGSFKDNPDSLQKAIQYLRDGNVSDAKRTHDLESGLLGMLKTPINIGVDGGQGRS